METGYWKRGTRAKEGAYETIGTIVNGEMKHALFDDDYEEYEEWVEYTPEELAERVAQEEARIKKENQEAFLEAASGRMDTAEVSIEDLMNAIAELGVLVEAGK